MLKSGVGVVRKEQTDKVIGTMGRFLGVVGEAQVKKELVKKNLQF